MTQDQIIRWAQHIREHPNSWNVIHTEFINAQFEKSNAFYEQLKKLSGGREKISNIFGIRNLKGYPTLSHRKV